MTFEELVLYTEQSLAKSGLKISDLGNQEMKKRFAKSENDGGYSDYWKNLSLEEANSKRNLKIDGVIHDETNRIIFWKSI
jgi:hypothetical protein